MMDKHTLTVSKLQMALSMAIFGTIGIFVKFIPLPSPVIVFFRGFIGVLFLLVLSLFRKEKISFNAIKNNLFILCILGVSLGLNWILLFEAYRYTTVATATLCYYLAPIFIVIASPFVLKEKISLKNAICAVIALLGMVFVSGIIKNGLPGINEIKGVLLGIGAAVLYAVIVMTNKKIKGIEAYDKTAAQLAISAIVMVPYVLLNVDISKLVFSTATVVLLIVVGIIHTGLAYALYFGSMGNLSGQTIAIFSYIDPVIAIILSVVVLKEKMDVYGVIGAVLILGAAFVSELSFKHNKPEKNEIQAQDQT